MATPPKESHAPAWFKVIALLVSLSAGVVAFLPFAVNTSPLNAVMLAVPGNQGNWWHALIGLPFFLAFPMIWLCLRSLFSMELSPTVRRLIWILVGLSICGTLLVELPFLLHRAGTSESQRLLVIGTGLGAIIASAILLFRRRHNISPDRACLVGLNTAYLANAALCLIVYAGMTGTIRSRLGWLATIVIVWPMLLELLWVFIQTPEAQTVPSKAAV
ncbi:MAG TPA: hypothetical protein VF214_09625 [Edaphobacter sp.]